MTIRQKLLEQFFIDCPSLKVVNGYTYDYKIFIKGYLPITDINKFPVIYIEYDTETFNEITETGRGLYRREVKVFIGVYIKVTHEQGNITDYMENVIKDLTMFIYQDKDIAGNETGDHKVLRWNLITSDSIGIEGWKIDNLSPYQDTKQGQALLRFELTVTYLDSYNN